MLRPFQTGQEYHRFISSFAECIMRTTILGMLLLTAAIASVGGTQPQPPPAKKETPAAVDRYGDSLPEGAIGRLGTVRFRHGRAANQIAYAAGGKVLASAGADMGICLWDAQTGRLLHQFTRDRFADSIAFSADGTKLFTGLALIDVASGKDVVTFKAPSAEGCQNRHPNSPHVRTWRRWIRKFYRLFADGQRADRLGKPR